jgi:hypothetical protein
VELVGNGSGGLRKVVSSRASCASDSSWEATECDDGESLLLVAVVDVPTAVDPRTRTAPHISQANPIAFLLMNVHTSHGQHPAAFGLLAIYVTATTRKWDKKTETYFKIVNESIALPQHNHREFVDRQQKHIRVRTTALSDGVCLGPGPAVARMWTFYNDKYQNRQIHLRSKILSLFQGWWLVCAIVSPTGISAANEGELVTVKQGTVRYLFKAPAKIAANND